MADMALGRIKAEDAKRRAELLKLKEDILSTHAEHIRRTQNHSAILPIELFTEVAQILVEEDQTSVLTLAHVCRHWRHVVCSNPSLWRSLVLGRSRPHAKAKLWLERSKGIIHELRVRAPAFERASWSGEGLETLQWEQLRVCAIANWDICRFLKQTGKINALVSLKQYEFDTEDRHIIPTRLFEPTWPIQHLTLLGTDFPSYFAELCADHIKSLILRNIRVAQNISLELHTSLETLTLENIGVPVLKLPTELQKLHRVELSRITSSTAKVLDIAMPDLRKLRIHSSPFCLDTALASLRRQGSIHLTELTLQAVPLGDLRKLIEFLQANPSLETLELSRISNGALDVLEALATRVGPDPSSPKILCPQLIHLNLSHCPDVGTGPLVRLVRSRNGDSSSPSPIQRIESLIVDGCGQIEAGWLEWFRQNVDRFSCIYVSKRAAKNRR